MVWIDNLIYQERPFTLFGKSSQDREIFRQLKAETLIIATGASAKWLGRSGRRTAPVGFGRQRRFGVRYLRRIFLSLQRSRHRRRRRHGDGRSDVLTRFASKVT
jgi:hypothetical protein